MMPVFVGYDGREDIAWRVCRRSISDFTDDALVIPIVRETLVGLGIHNRPFTLEGGQRFDLTDGKPFSTEFSFTRFHTPHLARLLLEGGWALFCDCDFLFTAPLEDLFALADPQYAVMCVQHNHMPAEETKMDGQMQTRYRRKNWSSLVLWNLDHPANADLTPETVNTMPGSWLHQFRWLQDHQIGALPVTWNWLSGVSEPIGEIPKGIHFTLGIPTMAGHHDHPYADLWRERSFDLCERSVP